VYDKEIKRGNKMIKNLSLFAAIILFSGCMASNYNEMIKDESIDKKSFTINENYQSLYQRGVAKIEECHEQGLLTAAITSDSKIYSDIKEANITVYMMGGLGKQMHHALVFKAIDNSSTKMDVYSYFGVEMVDILKKETTGECISCFCKEE
jgi:hypothetical protein